MFGKDDVRVSDVFGITRAVPLNYVTRKRVDDELVNSLSRDQHVVIYGSSKQGKTSLRKYHLKDDEHIVITCNNRWSLPQLHAAILKQAGYTIVQSETRTDTGQYKVHASAKVALTLFGKGVEATGGGESGSSREAQVVEARLELDPADVNEIIDALNEIGFNKWIILEDFHYLQEEAQKDFAVALKAFHESSDLTFIIVGVWLQENRLIQFNGDLSGRVSTVNADIWLHSELREAIEEGERLLNIDFGEGLKTRLLENSNESIYVVQESCLLACQQEGIISRPKHKYKFDPLFDIDNIVRDVVERQSARFGDFLSNFASGFGETELMMYKWLLLPVLMSRSNELEKGIHFRRIRKALTAFHPRKDSLNPGNITQALKGAASLQVQQGVKPLVLDYDQSLKRLNIVDRSYLIWQKYQEKSDLLDMASLPHRILDEWDNYFSSESEEEEEE